MLYSRFIVLLTLLFGSSQLLDGGKSWVQVQGTQDVSNIDGINGASSFKVVDGEDEVDTYKRPN